MDQLHHIIAQNLKKLRKERGLTLEMTAELTGVSKSMLGQIERGESSPTIATIWKIATGLHVSFTSFMEDNSLETRYIRHSDLEPLNNDGGRFRLYPVFPYQEAKGFEILSIEMDPGAYSDSLPHEEGTEEYVTVYTGELVVRVGNEEYHVPEGNSIRYRADRSHAYHNPVGEVTKLSMVICYKKSSSVFNR